MKRTYFNTALALAGSATLLCGCASSKDASAQDAPSPAEVRAIAKEAYTYGYPLVDNYRIQYA
ncbi:hypothetical protein P4C99_09455 [Pontiellaceae bacterium B1224]|nr:hypothetical protein [Pontiellaceae bacterium B1224]